MYNKQFINKQFIFRLYFVPSHTRCALQATTIQCKVWPCSGTLSLFCCISFVPWKYPGATKGQQSSTCDKVPCRNQ